MRKIRLSRNVSGLLALLAGAVLGGVPGATHAQVLYGQPAGDHPVLNVLVRFTDTKASTPHPREWYQHVVEDGDRYYKEVSGGRFRLTGSQTLDWINLSGAVQQYVDPSIPTKTWNYLKIMREVIAHVGARDDLSRYWGFVVFPNIADGNQGTSPMLRLDVGKGLQTFAGAFISPFGAQESIVVHEIGHNIGFDHAPGPYNNPYDSRWSPMSADSPASATPELGRRPVELSAYHKYKARWMDDGRVLEVPPGTRKTVRLERLADPTNTTDYLMAKVYIGGMGGQYYTVEARRLSGNDELGVIPGECVLIHQVDDARFVSDGKIDETGGFSRRAQVVDVDGNRDPNDAGAMWTPGKTFADEAHGIYVRVNAMDRTGFTVTIDSRAVAFQPTVVRTTRDDGPGSLRDALTYADDHPGTTITFHIPENDPGYQQGFFKISALKPLPELLGDGTVIDGLSQPGAQQRPLIFLDGSQVSVPTSGLRWFASGCTLRGVAVGNWKQDGIRIEGLASFSTVNKGGKHNTAQNCYIGLLPDGVTPAPNAWCGLNLIDGAGGDVVTGNVISGNRQHGLALVGGGGHRVTSNRIGTDPKGVIPLGNGIDGIYVNESGGNTIGGGPPQQANLVSANGNAGVHLGGAATANNTVTGNIVGMNAAGSAPLPNRLASVTSDGGTGSNDTSSNLLSP